MIAASAAGLDTCPMEGFDELRLKRLLKIPSYMTVPVIIPVGTAAVRADKQSIRLPLADKLSFNLFDNRKE